MAKNAVKDWDTTAGNNADVGGIGILGTNLVSNFDNAVREIMAQVATQLGKVGAKGSDLASASTTNLANATGWYVHITGTTAITALGTVAAGQVFVLEFDGALTLTHNGTSLILPGAANLTTAAGDVAVMVSEGSGNWRCASYTRASGQPVLQKAPTVQTFTGNGTWTKPAGCRFAVFEGTGGGGGSGSVQGTSGASAGSTGGGGAGFSGRTGMIDVSGTSSASVTIGAAGTAGSSGGAGGNGGNTSITIGATTYTWGGGSGSAGFNSNTSTAASTQPGTGGAGTNVDGHSQGGTMGVLSSLDQNAQGGVGGSSAFGRGGRGAFRNTAGITSGDAATGYGAGGGGSVLLTSVSTAAGTAGSAGYMRVWEFY